jgi:GT2 family glycosyltransferase
MLEQCIFKYNQWESVNSVMGYLNFSFLWYSSVFKFIKAILTSFNVLLCQTAQLYCYSQQWQFIKSECNVDEHRSVHIITRAVYNEYHDILLYYCISSSHHDGLNILELPIADSRCTQHCTPSSNQMHSILDSIIR